MRLFLGVMPAQAEARGIYDGCQRLSLDPEISLRWVPPENWHVTLVFLGEVADHLISALVDVVAPVVGGYRQMVLPLGGVEWFPSPSKPRLLTLRAEPPPQLCEMQKSLAAALRRDGFQLEQRAWRPHLTLARYRGPRKRFSAPSLPAVKPVPMELQAVTLFQSILGKSAPVYQPVQHFGLAS